MIEFAGIQELLLRLPAILIAFSFHEFAHAWTATKFGDDRPRREGRVTLDPRSHIDWLGFILLVIGGFGWARPVMVDTSKLRPRVLGDIVVSLAGVAMNMLLAIFFGMASLAAVALKAPDVALALQTFVQFNLLLVAINVLPLPPLDGFHVAKYLLPPSLQRYIPVLYQYGPFLLLLLFITGRAGLLILPILRGAVWLYSTLMTPFYVLLG